MSASTSRLPPIISRPLRTLATAVLAFAVGCAPSDSSGPDAGGACPSDLPASCPATVPSYKGEIAALIQQNCVGCHNAGGAGAAWPIGTYEGLYNNRQTALDEVYSCRMPLPDAGQLTDAERVELLTWFVCLAPDN